MRHFDTQFELKELAEDGTFEGYAAVFDKVDLGGDTIKKGAFTRTLKNMEEEKRVIPFCYMHDQKEILGGFHELKEDDFGLYVKGQIIPDLSPLSKKVYALMKSGLSRALSIGYRVPKGGSSKSNGIRTLKDLDLFEISHVSVGMDPFAQAVSVKALTDLREKLAKGDLLTARDFETLFKDSFNLTNSEAERAVRVNLKTGEGAPRAKKATGSVVSELHKLMTKG